MRLGEIDPREIRSRLDDRGLALRIGPFTASLRSRAPELTAALSLLYAHNEVVPTEGFIDYHLSVERPPSLRRFIRPQLLFTVDGYAPFMPLPVSQSITLFEWGFNWCIATFANRYLIIHAAAIERDGRVAILPGEPGSGKSTLCAALIHRGWRLLSDELTLLSPTAGDITPLARPVSLKNESIDVIRAYAADAVISERVSGTTKGTVALVRAPVDSIDRIAERARPAWIIFPKFVKGAPADLVPEPRARAFIELGRNSFNYSIHGRSGFDALAQVVDASACYRFSYGHLDDAIATFAALEPP